MSDDTDSARPKRRWGVRILGGSFVALAAGAVGWAGATVLTPATDVLDASAFTYIEVAPDEVGSSITLNTVAQWTPVPVGANQAVGVVTTVNVVPGDEVGQASVLYTVNLRQVVVAQGTVPAYRSIDNGAQGRDVAQLQEMLTAAGHFSGVADGVAGPATAAAIREWQRSLGLERTGVVEFGDVIFVPSLPSRVALDTEVMVRGASLVGGEVVVQGLPSAPTFHIPATASQAATMPLNTRVEIEAGDSVWEAVVTDQTSDEATGDVNIGLEGRDGAVACGEECGEIPVTGQVLLRSRIITIETVTGLAVPSAALVTGADGQVVVIGNDEVRYPVSVVASAQGMSVIEGVEQGLRVRLPAAIP